MRKQRIYKLLGFLALFSLSLLALSLAYAEEALPLIEPQPLGVITPQQREEREFHRFVRGLEEYLRREDIVVKRGIYIEADSVFEIRYLTPEVPFRVSIANATEDRLTLEEIRLYSPMRKPMFSQSLYRALQPAAREIRQLKGLREEIRGIKGRARIQGRIAPQERKALAEIHSRRAKLLGEIRAKSAHTTTTVDLTPYLKEVEDKTTITVQATFTHEGRPLTVEREFTFTLDHQLPTIPGWSRGDFHIHSEFSDGAENKDRYLFLLTFSVRRYKSR